jgi:hypothetical protein
MHNVFVSYSRKDVDWVKAGERKERALMSWLRTKLEPSAIELWWDERLDQHVGQSYEELIRERIESSDTAILLLSEDFFLSRFISDFELPLIKERVESQQMQLFPIVVSHVDWNHNEYSQWIRTRHIHNSVITPLIEVVRDEAEWSKVRSRLAVALREQVLPRESKRSEPRQEAKHRGAEVEGTQRDLPSRLPSRLWWVAGSALALMLVGVMLSYTRSFSPETAAPEQKSGSNGILDYQQAIGTPNSLSDIGLDIVQGQPPSESTIATIEGLLTRSAPLLDQMNAQVTRSAPPYWLCDHLGQLIATAYQIHDLQERRNARTAAALHRRASDIASSEGTLLHCADTTWRSFHHEASFLFNLGIEEERAFHLIGLALEALEIELSSIDPDVYRILLQQANSLLLRARRLERNGSKDLALADVRRANQFCETLFIEVPERSNANAEHICAEIPKALKRMSL